ncbi:MAG TPA: ATP-dependent DNA ligase [Oligoflexus sp.]|uniref:ATP-dependent DNA ligase n=1 Tax=Oligoflexus sp. TaxID=1971216 RepID=UPI002D42507C|nr:ATP-dependent DNA ligase [Oligoflexus sp.]HYX34213.1 ATP-dependent DNA ligase [Oligoflexus sp.]
MRRFLTLFQEVDATTSTLAKREALATYFRNAPATDAIWALYLLMGRKQKRLVNRRLLQDAVLEMAAVSPWLFEECYAVVGDLAETISLLVPQRAQGNVDVSLQDWMEIRLPQLSGTTPREQVDLLQSWWREHNRDEIFMITKLITGGFRAGVARQLMIKSLADAFGQEEPYVTEQLTGDWPVTATFIESLREPVSGDVRIPSTRPYPFYLASSIQEAAREDIDLSRYAIEWKWDGIRAQLVRRGPLVAIWSRGEELISDSFPEIVQAAHLLPEDCVLDGEMLLQRDGKILPFAELQKRISRKKISEKMLGTHPAIFLAFDCLERAGVDLRGEPQSIRREHMEQLLHNSPSPFHVSPLLQAKNWEEAAELRQQAEVRGGEGLMLKSWDGAYKQGRKRGDWWKWKVDPMTLDSVLVYAQAGHGRRATLFTDYTFALWKDGALVPFAKAYSGLTDAEIQELDAWIRRHTLERFGPVRSVTPERVFEIAFEGIGLSSRHKSGLAVRFPRILRERFDKKPDEADTVERARELIDGRTQDLTLS